MPVLTAYPDIRICGAEEIPDAFGNGSPFQIGFPLYAISESLLVAGPANCGKTVRIGVPNAACALMSGGSVVVASRGSEYLEALQPILDRMNVRRRVIYAGTGAGLTPAEIKLMQRQQTAVFIRFAEHTAADAANRLCMLYSYIEDFGLDVKATFIVDDLQLLLRYNEGQPPCESILMNSMKVMYISRYDEQLGGISLSCFDTVALIGGANGGDPEPLRRNLSKSWGVGRTRTRVPEGTMRVYTMTETGEIDWGSSMFSPKVLSAIAPATKGAKRK